MEWAQALLRFREHCRTWTHDTVIVFRETPASFAHSTPFCAPSLVKAELTPEQAIELDAPVCMECTGWTSTRFGFELATAREAFLTLDLEADGCVHPTWRSLHRQLSLFTASGSNASSRNPDLERLWQAATESALRTAGRSLATLESRQLAHALAAQGIRIPVTGAEAPSLVRWAAQHRLTRTEPVQGDRNYPRFDEQVASALESQELRTIAVAVSPSQNPLDWAAPVELSLLAWADGTTAGGVRWLHVPVTVADGIRALGAGRSVGVADEHEADSRVLETASVLWTDAQDQVSLTEALRTARHL